MRFIASILLGVVVTFGLFVVMAELIAGGDKSKQDELEQIVVELNTTPPESKAQQRNRVPPPPPPPPKQPPKPQVPEPEPDVSNNSVSLNMPAIDIGTSNGTTLSGPGLIQDGDATPIVRIDPQYPPVAQRDGIEGWVKLSFDINELGAVENVKILDAKPKRVFNRAARSALRKWKYKPKMENGKPLYQTGLTVQLDFKLGE